ncbi:MAG: hypothetical protein ACM3WV_08665 [Bacillota bacterium]
MKKITLFCLLLTCCLFFAHAERLFPFHEGTYALIRTDDWAAIKNVYFQSDFEGLAVCDNMDRETFKLTYQLEKPESILHKGILTFGNSKEKHHFTITTSKNICFDQNSDMIITESEVFEPDRQYTIPAEGADFQIVEIRNLPLLVKYQKTDGSFIIKKITLWFNYRKIVLWPGYKLRDGSSSLYSVIYRVNTYFKGEGRMQINGKEKIVKFILIDGNHNAVYGDAMLDWLVVDKNMDGVFDTKQERQWYIKRCEPETDDEPVWLRLHMFAYPHQLIVAPDDGQVPAPEALEPPESDVL